MSPLASTSPFLRWIVVGSAVIWWVSELTQSMTHRSEGVKASRGGEILFRLIIGMGAIAAGVLSGARWAVIRPAAAAACIGLVLFWGGVSLRLWSFHTLGRFFTFTIQTSGDQPVIAEGPYRVIRHPSYTGLLLILMGIGLFIGSWLSLICLILTATVALVLRIRVEEQALMQDLGEGYRDYAATHKRLVPFVW